ncbi:metalloregulator ArsR/SmtB family transcription factor [Balneolaceae bacterium ANBcel3]|nr:metalloregulator ArsR/SmtB family transcription factor [Balneolaceae bacterium ANBcel3]
MDYKIGVQKLEHCASVLKAIAHPLRIAIIELLEEYDSLYVSEIYEKLEIEQAVASHHLAILKNKGVVLSVREGKNMKYELRHRQITKIIEIMERCSTQ